jgi:hypothetical protein
MKLRDLIRGVALGMWDLLCTVSAFAAAVVAGVLPRRVWPRLNDRIPMWRAATASGIFTIFVACAVGVPGYFSYARANSAQTVILLLQSTGWMPIGAGEQAPAGSGETNLLAGVVSPFTFALLTPIGLLATYLGVTGFLRAVSAYVDDPRGDPLLTLIDAVMFRTRRKATAGRDRRTREELEGPEVPDRLVPGTAAGFPDADFVVVTSRRKPGWERGVFVITPDVWYRIGVPTEMTLHSGLRTLYPLTEIRDLEVVRRSVDYVLPPLSGASRLAAEESDT